MIDMFIQLGLALILAIILIYMIMASLFESLVHPFTIMLAVPFIVTGVFIGLFITGTSLCVTSFIGIIMLVGIVVTNSIVLVDYINKLRERGMEIEKAITLGGELRLRPILLTALCTMLALIPVAIGIGEGSEMEKPMAIAVIGGLFTSTLLTLVIIPVVYKVIDDFGSRVKKKINRALHNEG